MPESGRISNEEYEFAAEMRKVLNINNPQFHFRINLDPPPNELLQLGVEYVSLFENALVVYHADSMMVHAPLNVFKSHKDDGSKKQKKEYHGYDTKRNGNTIIAGFHKTSPPNGNLPWCPSPVKIVERGKHPSGYHFIVVGFEDSTSWEFNGLRVRVEWK